MADNPDQPADAPAPRWDPALYEHHAYVWRYGSDLIELLDPRPGERVLDLGCGTGQLTSLIASRKAEVVGIDRSPEMIDQARRQHPGLRFEVADATTFTAEFPFDAVFSNAVLHWVRPPEAAVARIWHALRPGGRLVAEFGGRGNIVAVCGAIRETLTELGATPFDGCNPWYFPSVGEYSGVLEAQGFEVVLASMFDRPTPLQEGDGAMHDWLRMFGGSFLAGLSPAEQDAFIRLTVQRLRPALYQQGRWVVDHRRLQILARRPLDDDPYVRARP